MKAVLHPYQETAAGWLRERPEAALLLDMGLGKTLIALTEMCIRDSRHPPQARMGTNGRNQDADGLWEGEDLQEEP